VKRRFRLTRSTDIKRVRRTGKSYAHPLIVLYALQTGHPVTRVSVTAGLKVGNAVQRNRAKRLLREAMNPLLATLVPGYSLMLVGRFPLASSTLEETRTALHGLLHRAKLVEQPHAD
jgi:ribonuclease P protein component